jgi:hypothetical protein
MSLRDEIKKLVKEHSKRLIQDEQSESEHYELAFSRINEIKPLLEEIKSSAERNVIQIDIREKWDTYTVATFIRLGDIKFYGDWTHSGDMLPLGEGSYWYFFPCYSDEGNESWSFNDQRSGHKWFDSLEEMMDHLIPRVAEEIAVYEHKSI